MMSLLKMDVMSLFKTERETLEQNLADTLGNHDSARLLNYMENYSKQCVIEATKGLATKADLFDLRSEMREDVRELREDAKGFRDDFSVFSDKMHGIMWRMLVGIALLLTIFASINKLEF